MAVRGVHLAGIMVALLVLLGLAAMNQQTMGSNQSVPRQSLSIPFKRIHNPRLNDIVGLRGEVDESSAAADVSDDRVKVDFFVMSKCPDAKFCENLWGNALGPIASIIDADMSYFGTDNGAGSFTCMHGAAECEGNIQQLCVKNMTSPSLQWMDFANCQSSNLGAVPGNGKECAQRLKLDWDTIDHCVRGPLGKELFSASIKKKTAAGALKSCTLQLNGKDWCVHDGYFKNCNDGNTAADLTRAVCTRYQGTDKPAACQ